MKRRNFIFEILEYVTLARQMAESLSGKRIVNGTLGNSPHKFVWYNRKPDELPLLSKERPQDWLIAGEDGCSSPSNRDICLFFRECGGRIRLHESESQLPKKYHLSLHFDDGSFLSATTQMWGAMELYEEGKELERQHIKGMRATPVDQKFNLAYLSALIEECANEGSRSVKGLLTQDQLIPGLGNSIAQDIMFKAKLHPKQSISSLSKAQIKNLHEAIMKTVAEVIRQGGRNDKTDLYGNRGKYKRIMDKTAAGRPCPECARIVEKMTYSGGVCYYCPGCQGECK